jgi:hypothetical protein
MSSTPGLFPICSPPIESGALASCKRIFDLGRWLRLWNRRSHRVISLAILDLEKEKKVCHQQRFCV